jgi:hypothetical protein
MTLLDRFSIAGLFAGFGLLLWVFAQILFAPQPAAGASSEVTYHEMNTSAVYIGKDLDTGQVVATSTGRLHLTIQNAGATTTGTVFCSTNDRPPSLYSGFVLSATSSKEFNLDNMYRGAIRCKAVGASTTLFIQER